MIAPVAIERIVRVTNPFKADSIAAVSKSFQPYHFSTPVNAPMVLAGTMARKVN